MTYMPITKKHIPIILLLLLNFSHINAQNIVKIIDFETKLPLDLVTFSSTKPNASIVSNEKGLADLSEFLESNEIKIRRIGYETLVLSFENIKNNQFVVELYTNTMLMDEMVVSATKWQQALNKLPSKISKISQKEVALLNPQTAADLLGISGEVFIQKSQQGGGSPMIRGFSTNRLLYNIDGVRMNTAIFRSGNIQNVISLDPFAIENTEVFFGSGSVIYGSDAIGGVMSFQTLKPQFSDKEQKLVKGKVFSRYSSINNEFTNHFDFNIGSKKWAAITSITYADFKDLKMGSKGPADYLKTFYVERINNTDQIVENKNPLVQTPTAYSQINLMQKLRYRLNENVEFNYGFHFSETSSYSRYDRLIETNPNGLPVSAVWDYGPQKWLMNYLNVQLKYKTKFFDHFDVKLAHQQFGESRIDRRFNNHRLRTQTEEVDAFSINFDFVKKINNHQFIYGLEYVINRVDSSSEAIDIRNGNAILTPSRYPNSDWASYAAFLNYQYLINDKWTLQSGLRYNHFDLVSNFENHLSFFQLPYKRVNLNNGTTTGSFGLVYNPNKSSKVGLNASSGFRAPNVDDIGKFFDFTANEIVMPNPDLKAEYAYNIEITFSKIFDKYIKFDLATFYTYLDNAMVRRPFTFNNQSIIDFNGNPSQVFAIQNAAFGTVYGFNAGVELNLTNGFKLNSKFNYQHGVEEMDKGEISRSRHAAPAFGTTTLNYAYKKFNCQIYAIYSAKVTHENLNEEERQKPFIYAKDDNGKPYSPSWYTLNFKASSALNDTFNITAGLENITDIRYRPYSSGLVAGGRNFVLGLTGVF